jgi:hypothetical protein
MLSPSLAGRNSDVAIKTVDGKKNHATKIQLPSRRNDGVCDRNKPTKHSSYTCQKASSVTATWGWGSFVITADFGNNTEENSHSCL